ncbi:TPA: DUF6527 family protein [Citrobacter braakii]
MLKIKKLEHRFIRSIPRELDVGVIYISMEYATAVHSCCCGCGEQVVTPFSPTDWKMIFDGESVSLAPSIGNWHSTCRSHYIIKQGIIIEAGSWNDAQISAERKRAKLAKADYYNPAPKSLSPEEETKDTSGQLSRDHGVVGNFLGWLCNLIRKN